MNEQEQSSNPEPKPQIEPTADEPKVESRFGWLQGFVDIITAPDELAMRLVRSSGRVVAFAVLLYTFVGVGVQYLHSINDGIRGEMYSMQAASIEKIAAKQGLKDSQVDEMLEDMKKNLDFSAVRNFAIMFPLAFLGVVLIGWLFWLMQRLFNAEPPPAFAIIGLAAYGTSITALGLLLGGLMQFAGNSLAVAPTLAFIARPIQDNAGLFQFLSSFSLFTVWEYLVVGIVVARHVGMSRNHGLAFGGAVLALRLLLGAIPLAVQKAFAG
jgi:hypothetical protein